VSNLDETLVAKNAELIGNRHLSPEQLYRSGYAAGMRLNEKTLAKFEPAVLLTMLQGRHTGKAPDTVAEYIDGKDQKYTEGILTAALGRRYLQRFMAAQARTFWVLRIRNSMK